MKSHSIIQLSRGGFALALALSLSACGGGSGTADSSTPAGDGVSAMTDVSAAVSMAAIAQPANTNGRLLASNCFQCHGTLGLGGFEKIRGSEAGEVLDFLSKPANSNIMAAHAQGYTREQLQAVIAYLKQ